MMFLEYPDAVYKAGFGEGKEESLEE